MTEYGFDASKKILPSLRVCVMINMHTTHDFIQEAETILFQKESDTVQGISCLHRWKI